MSIALPARPPASLSTITGVTPRVSVPQVWRDTLIAFSAHSASILSGAFLGFALVAILSSLLGALVTLDMYARTSVILVTYGPNRIIPLAFQAAVGLLAGSLARGVISWRVLHPGANAKRPRHVLRAILPYWGALMLTALVTGALLFLGNLGLNALLAELRFDLADIGQLSATPNGMAHSIIMRTASSLIPDPGAPFSEFLTYLRLESSRVSTTLVYAGGLSYYFVKNIDELPLAGLYGAVGLVALFVVDTLQRFVVSAIVLPDGAVWWRRIGAALLLSVRRFGLVMAHTWLVRGAIFVVSTVFMTAPLVLTQSILVPLLIRTTGTAWPYLITTVLLSISIALVSMVLIAFSVVYDACLYRRLRG